MASPRTHTSGPRPSGRRFRRRWLALLLASALVSGGVTHAWIQDAARSSLLGTAASVPAEPGDITLAAVGEQPEPAPQSVLPSRDAAAASPLFVRAMSLHRAGQLPEAARAFQDVAAQAPGSEQAVDALIAFGQTQFSLRRFDEAANAFNRVIAERPAGVQRGQALFWLGRLAQEKGEAQLAAARYTEAAAALPDLAAYIHVQAADALAAGSAYREAAAQLQLAANGGGAGMLRAEIDLKLAEFTGNAGDAAESARRYRALMEQTQNPWERSGHQFHLAEALRQTGAHEESRQLLYDILVRYPSTSYAGRALATLSPQPGQVNPLLEGVVAYYQRENERAAAALALAASDPVSDQGRALYFLGLLAERRDAAADALTIFDQLLREQPTHVLAEEARWERALMFEALGQLPDAVAAYRELREAHPNGQNAGEAGFREGLALYKLGDPLGAAAAWVQAQDGAAIPVRTRNLFWAGKAVQQAGDGQEARRLWQEAASLRPGSYYSDRAGAMLNGGGEPIPSSVVPLSAAEPDAAADQQQLADWLASWAAGGQPLPAVSDVRQTLLATPGFRRADALLSLGLRAQAVEEFRELRSEYRRDPVAQVALIGLFRERGLYHLASSAGYALLDVSGTALSQAPAAVQRVISPAPFADLLNQEAVKRGVDPLVFLALIHQESAFDTGATSAAEALGLTQVVPSTGRALAKELGLSDFQPEDLYRPIVSLQFGAQYLAEQLRLFDGNAVQALAAYNAGPGSALRWARAANGDIDLFVEEIDFAQTSTYVKKIAETAARYRALYGRAG